MKISMHFKHIALTEPAQSATKLGARQRANRLYPLRDGSEKFDGFPQSSARDHGVSPQKSPARGGRAACKKGRHRIFRARHVTGERLA